jgi:TonB family protein
VPAAPAAPELPPLPPLSVPDGIPAATSASAPARPSLPPGSAGVADLLGAATVVDGIASSTEGIQPPRLLSAGRPPAAGSELRGRVEVRFIVDSLGGVDRGSIAIVAATDSALAAAARAIVARARFEPGRSGGRRIPVLVRQHVTFDP